MTVLALSFANFRETHPVHCDNCGWQGTLQTVVPEIPDVQERIEPGGEVPAGVCPECQALCYLTQPTPKLIINLHGGVVQDILHDVPTPFDIYVVDWDVNEEAPNHYRVPEEDGKLCWVYGVSPSPLNGATAVETAVRLYEEDHDGELPF